MPEAIVVGIHLPGFSLPKTGGRESTYKTHHQHQYYYIRSIGLAAVKRVLVTGGKTGLDAALLLVVIEKSGPETHPP